MTKKNNINKVKLTEHVTYLIEDSTIYLLLDESTITKEELNIVYKKISLIIEDKELSYINISGKKLEDNKTFFQDLGFTLSYYDVNTLNTIYSGTKDKKMYKCYGLMTKKDFLESMKESKKEIQNELPKIVTNSYSGFVSSMLLLIGGIILLCYFCVQGAIYLIKWEEFVYDIR